MDVGYNIDGGWWLTGGWFRRVFALQGMVLVGRWMVHRGLPWGRKGVCPLIWPDHTKPRGAGQLGLVLFHCSA